MKKNILILGVILLLSNACKSHKAILNESTSNISAKKLSRKLKQNRFKAKRFESRFTVDYQDDNKRFSGGGKIKVLKDSMIWGSINFMGIPAAKFLLTPTKIQYYNKVEQVYYDGDYQSVYELTGVELNFQNIQNILFADVLMPINPVDYDLSVNPKFYQLKSKHRDEMLQEIKINSFFKIISELLQKNNQSLQVDYPKFITIENQIIPEFIRFNAQGEKGNLSLKIEFKNPVINKNTRYPFKIPSNYSPM